VRGCRRHPLALLHELWNTDKNRTISQFVTLFDPERGVGDRDLQAFEAASTPLTDGKVIDRWLTPPRARPTPRLCHRDVRSSGRVETGLLFGDSQITVDTPISLRAAAKEIVDHCASPFFWPTRS
jgi:hypothetical protein